MDWLPDGCEGPSSFFSFIAGIGYTASTLCCSIVPQKARERERKRERAALLQIKKLLGPDGLAAAALAGWLAGPLLEPLTYGPSPPSFTPNSVCSDR